MTKPTLTLEGVSKRFGSSLVLHPTDLSLHAGERLAVVGPSGSGKTTLLRLIAGLEPASNGTIRIEDRVVSSSDRIMVKPERRGVAMVFQGLALFPQLRALDQIAFAARGSNRKKTAMSLLERVGLGDRANAPLDELSGGERQRIALARALAQSPTLLLMDEPFANLDDQTRREMRSVLRHLLDQQRMTLVLVTHSHDDALDLADKALVLDRGRTAACGSMRDLIDDPRTVAAARSLGLGQVIDGQTLDGKIAVTAFGEVALRPTDQRGAIKLLIRAGQPKLLQGGVEAIVISVEPRPSNWDGEPLCVMTVRVGTHQLLIHVVTQTPKVGDRVFIIVVGESSTLVD